VSKIKLSENFIKNTVKLALNEDLYPSGDITSDLIQNNKITYNNKIVYCVHQYDRLDNIIKKKMSIRYNYIE